MSFEGSMVFFAALCCLVEKSAFSLVLHVVVEPLLREWDDDVAAKEFWMLVGGCSPVTKAKGGRAALCTQREYDSTLGYPGEDGRQLRQPVCNCNLLWLSLPSSLIEYF